MPCHTHTCCHSLLPSFKVGGTFSGSHGSGGGPVCQGGGIPALYPPQCSGIGVGSCTFSEPPWRKEGTRGGEVTASFSCREGEEEAMSSTNLPNLPAPFTSPIRCPTGSGHGSGLPKTTALLTLISSNGRTTSLTTYHWVWSQHHLACRASRNHRLCFLTYLPLPATHLLAVHYALPPFATCPLQT